MRLCAVSFKECWRADGRWWSSGGFPLQMSAIASLFDALTLAIVEVPPRAGGLPLPDGAEIVTLRPPRGQDFRRKLSILAGLPSYLSSLLPAVRRADVVHVPLPGDIPLLALLLAVLARKRVIARYGGSWSRTDRTTAMNVVTRGLMRGLAGGRHVMLATGEGTTPPARGMSWIFATALSQAELEEDRPVLDRGLFEPMRLVYIGRLSPEKGVVNLIRALARLREAGAVSMPWTTLIGDGPERSALENEARRLNCADRVVFLGQLDRAGLARRLGDADVCVQPSLTEGFSKAWLDAMAAGVPVVASEVGAARTVIGGAGERGWLVPPGSVDALAGTLQSLQEGRVDWPALRRRCRAFAESRTLESWTSQIGETCARQWRIAFEGGKFRV